MRIALLAVAVMVIAIGCSATKEPLSPKDQTRQTLDRLAVKCLNAWDGSYEPLSDYLKLNILTFPDTWRHHDTRVFERDGEYRVMTRFTASGLFGQERFVAEAEIDRNCAMQRVVDVAPAPAGVAW